jgi:phosphatidylglycerol:prolipoprotein diacylglycerol transferase
MHPLLGPWEPFSIPVGPVSIHGFGILVALGFLLGSTVSQRKAERFGGDPEAVNRLVGWLVIGTFVGGHLGDVLWYKPDKLARDPELFVAMVKKLATLHLPAVNEIPLILRVWEGLSSFGGFAVCVPLTVYFFWKDRKPFFPHGDGLVIGLTLGWMFGRLGCFSAHDHPGTQTNFWFGVYGMCEGHNPDIACHDLGLYEAIWSGTMWVLFEWLSRRPRFPGFYCAVLALTYAPFRFVLDFFRTASIDVRYGAFTPAQYGTMALFLVGLLVFVTQRGKPVMWREAPAATPAAGGSVG